MFNKIQKVAAVTALALCGAATMHAEFITTKSETLKVWADPITVNADDGTVSTLTVYENDIINYSSFNMVITVPEGITIAKVKQGRETVDDIFLTERAAASHTIACNMLDDGRTIKIISYSIQLDEFYPDDVNGEPLDALFTLGLVASPEMVEGEYECTISDVKFVETSTDASILPNEPLTFTLTVAGGKTNAIEDVTSEKINESPAFDLQGRRVRANANPRIIISAGQKKINR